MTRIRTFAKIGATALRIYVCHILVFAIGVSVGAFMGVSIAYSSFIAMLKMQGLL